MLSSVLYLMFDLDYIVIFHFSKFCSDREVLQAFEEYGHEALFSGFLLIFSF